MTAGKRSSASSAGKAMSCRGWAMWELPACYVLTMKPSAPVVAVCGTGTTLEPVVFTLARDLGAALARAGFLLVTGGLGGVMEAASRGAKEAGGFVVGVVPGGDRQTAHPLCGLVIPRGLGGGREFLRVPCAGAVGLVGGGAGTLAGAAFAWRLGKPLLALVPSGGWAAALAGRAIDDRHAGAVEPVDSPERAVARIRELLGARAVE